MVLFPAEIAQGPMFIGVVLNICLYGIMITQTFLYFTNFYNDKLWMKCFVVLLFVADTVNSVFDIIYLYNTLIVHFDDLSALGSANWVFATDPALTGLIAMLVQLFFAWRVKILTGNNWIVTTIVTLAISGGLGGLATAVAVGIIPQFINFQKFRVVVIIWLAAECVSDFIITTSLVWHLRKHKTGFKETDTLVNRLIIMTVQTGMVTSLCAIVDLILYLCDPTGLHLLFNMPLSKLYTNSLMSSLNTRGRWRYTGGGTFQSTQDARKLPDVGQLNCQPGVLVSVERHEMTDVCKSDRSFTIDESPELAIANSLEFDRGKQAVHEAI
jgi:hypothetical protein